MSNFARRFRELRIEQELTQDELSRKLEISKSAISMYENGKREPDFETLELIADFFNVDMNHLMGYDVPKHTPSYEAAAGEGRICDAPTGEANLRVDEDQVVVTVRGRSMEPTLMDGDLVVVEATSVADSPTRIYLVKVNGEEHTLKHVVMNEDGLTLTADNMSVFPPRLYTAQQVKDLPVTIEGVVVRLVREME